METKLIIVGGIEYKVYSPGRILNCRIGNPNNPATPYYIIDQLDSDLTPIREKFFPDHLKKYGLTVEEYFNLVVHGDPTHKDTCPYCGSKLSFKGLRAFGGRGYNKYCNASHQTLYEAKLGIHSFQIRRENNEAVSSNRMKLLNKEMMANGTHPLTKKTTISRRIYSRTKSKFLGKDHAILYVASLKDSKYKDYIKIGVTSGSLESRKAISAHYSLEYLSIHRLVDGDPLVMADLENAIREAFLNESVIGTETYDRSKLRDILEFIKNYKLVLNQ